MALTAPGDSVPAVEVTTAGWPTATVAIDPSATSIVNRTASPADTVALWSADAVSPSDQGSSVSVPVRGAIRLAPSTARWAFARSSWADATSASA